MFRKTLNYVNSEGTFDYGTYISHEISKFSRGGLCARCSISILFSRKNTFPRAKILILTRILCILQLSVHKAHDARFSALLVQYSAVRAAVARVRHAIARASLTRDIVCLCIVWECAYSTVLYCVEIQTNLRVNIDGIRERHGACTVYLVA